MPATTLEEERMRKPLRVLAIAALALLALPAFGGTAMAAPTTTVKLGDNFFNPRGKVVRRGTLVRFRWVGNRPHNVVKRRGPGPRFRSRTTRRRGVNFAKRFKQRGAYKLVCTIHPRTMRLTLKVR
jgi:plastocyanin